jgi:hypothetical protein
MGTWSLLLRSLRARALEVDIGIGCLVPLALVVGVAVGAGVLIGAGLGQVRGGSDQVVARVIDDGAVGGGAVLSTQVVPLR